MKRSVARLSVLLVVAATALLAACGDGGDDGYGTEGLKGEIEVSAATSLRVAMGEIGDAFTNDHPGVDVVFNFDSSATLASQILEGAPADVFASADDVNMARLVDAGEVDGTPDGFATNRLVVITKSGNPEGISDLADLADAGIISLCGEDVPCGRYAQQALERAGVAIPESNVTRGQNVAATLTAVSEGDAAAAIVYVTDAIAAGDAVEQVEIPPDSDVVVSYPIAALAGAGRGDIARAFVDFVVGPEGQALLKEHGFLPPG